MEKQSIIQVGGSVESAIKGDYVIDVKKILNEAWQSTKTNRRSINLGLLIIFIFAMFISLFASQYLGGAETVVKDPKLATLVNILVTMIIWPFLAGVEMMGVLHAVGFKTHVKFIYSFLKRGSWVALGALMTSLLISVGFQLFIVPGIFLAVVFSLTIPLIVEKKMTPWQAIIISVKALRFRWFQILLLYLLLSIILVISVLPLIFFSASPFFFLLLVLFLFTLSYLAPMFYHIKGILYREIFGLNFRKITNNDDTLSSNDTFSA